MVQKFPKDVIHKISKLMQNQGRIGPCFTLNADLFLFIVS